MERTISGMMGKGSVNHNTSCLLYTSLAFKSMADPFVGKLAFFRVYSGKCKAGSYVLNATKDKNCLLYTSRCV